MMHLSRCVVEHTQILTYATSPLLSMLSTRWVTVEAALFKIVTTEEVVELFGKKSILQYIYRV